MVSKNELKFIKSLKVKKYRVREKRFVVEGAKNVQELVKSDYKVDLILCSNTFFKANDELLENLRVEIVSDKVLNETGSFQSNNSGIAMAETRILNPESIDLDTQAFVLDGVSDPGNLGTIIRTLDWFGFDQLICSEDSADLYNPKVINSTMGSFTRVNVYHTDLEVFLKRNTLPVYGMFMNGTNLFESSIKIPSTIVLGSESHGISEHIQSVIDHAITIPGRGGAESLNVGTAAGIVASYLRML